MRKAGLAIVLSLAGLAASAQESQALYAAVAESVIFLQHSIRLSSADSSQVKLWRRYEEIAKRKLLDADYPLVSGSGFFLSDEGYALTNRHVAKVPSLPVLRYRAAGSMERTLSDRYSSSFSAAELASMKKDFETMLEKGSYSFAALSPSKTLGEARILACSGDDDPDLALIRVEGGPYRGLKLVPDSSIGPGAAGMDVWSFGYPLGSTLDELLKERAVTMNRGSVSAYRSAELGLQHSAAISGGNSGGPLVDAKGLVVGVNTASLQEQKGNSLFYAIDAAKARAFLSAKGYNDLLLWNSRIQASASSNLRQNALGEFEASADLLLDIPRDVSIILDGVETGKGPGYLTLTKPLSSLELRGPSGIFATKLRLLSSLAGTTTLKPTLGAATIPLEIATEPSGTRVFADGKLLGATPLKVDLVSDSYDLRFRSDSGWFSDAALAVSPEGPASFSFVGEEAWPVTLEGLSPNQGTRLVFTSERGRAVFLAGEEPRLPQGDWKLSVNGHEALAGIVIPLCVQSAPLSLDITPYEKSEALRIVGIEPAARLWVDDKPFDTPQGEAIRLPLGRHSVFAWKEGRMPLERIQITVRPGEDNFVTWQNVMGHDAQSSLAAWEGGGYAAAGAAIFAAGLYFGQNSVAMGLAENYSKYKLVKTVSSDGVVIGAALFACGGYHLWIALNESRKYRAQRAYLETLEGSK